MREDEMDHVVRDVRGDTAQMTDESFAVNREKVLAFTAAGRAVGRPARRWWGVAAGVAGGPGRWNHVRRRCRWWCFDGHTRCEGRERGLGGFAERHEKSVAGHRAVAGVFVLEVAQAEEDSAVEQDRHCGLPPVARPAGTRSRRHAPNPIVPCERINGRALP